MYFCNMYCYGEDNTIVGITGIVGCMGIVFVGKVSMYAIHIPPGAPATDKKAAEDFARWIRHQENETGSGFLFGFVNGSNRTEKKNKLLIDADTLLRQVKKDLKKPTTELVRVMRHLGQGSGGSGADSCVIMVERVHVSDRNPSGTISWIKNNRLVTWGGGGKRESGQYKNNSGFQDANAPSDLEAQWWRVDENSCTIASL